MRTALWVGLGVSIAASAMSPSARACSCVYPETKLVWPEPGAEGVALDTPVVVAFEPPLAPRAWVEDEGGERIELTEQRRLTGRAGACSPGAHAVFVPSAPLSPSTRYTVELGVGSSLTPTQEPFALSAPDDSALQRAVVPPGEQLAFSTGSQTGASDEPTIDAQLFSGVEPQWGERQSELWVRISSSEPLFVQARTDVDAALYLAKADAPFPIPVGPAECVELAVSDLRGRSLTEQRFCEPRKCVPVQALFTSSCGDIPLGLTWQDWEAVPEGCEAALAEDSVFECSLPRAPSSSRAGGALAALSLVALARFVRRRRSTR